MRGMEFVRRLPVALLLIRMKAKARLAAKPPGVDHFLQQGAGPELGVAKIPVQHFEDVQAYVHPDEVRQAYHKMARLYHPDRIASYELPDEVKEYARAMLVRINLAFEQLRR